jgi:hypothetical protein
MPRNLRLRGEGLVRLLPRTLRGLGNEAAVSLNGALPFGRAGTGGASLSRVVLAGRATTVPEGTGSHGSEQSAAVSPVDALTGPSGHTIEWDDRPEPPSKQWVAGSSPARGHEPDLRNSVVGVWQFIGRERHFHVDRVLAGLEHDPQVQAVEQRPELGLR